MSKARLFALHSVVFVSAAILPGGAAPSWADNAFGGQEPGPRKARYTYIPIRDQIQPGEPHVVLVDTTLMSGDGPLLSLPREPEKFPGVLEGLVRFSQAIVIGEFTTVVGSLSREDHYIESTKDVRVLELLKRGNAVKEGTILQVKQSGGTAMVDGTRVDLHPAHVRQLESGTKALLFVLERTSGISVFRTYAVLPDDTLGHLDLLRMPAGFEDKLGSRKLSEIRKRIAAYLRK